MDRVRAVTLKYITVFLAMNFSFVAGAALYGAYLRSRGLSLTEMAFVDGVYVGVSLMFMAMGGGFSDKYGRRKSLCYGLALQGFGFLTYGLSENFYQFLLAELLFALGSALNLNSLEAWYVDEMRVLTGEKYYDYSRVFGTASALTALTSVSGSLLAGWLGMFSLNVPFLFGALAYFMLVFVVYKLLSENKGESSRQPLLVILRKGCKNVVGNKVLLLLAFSSLFLSLSRPFFTLTYQAYLYDLGLSAQTLGVFAALFLLTNSLSGLTVVPKKSFKKLAYMTLSSTLLVFVGYFGLSNHYDLTFFVLYAVLWEMGTGMRRPLFRAWMNLEVSSDRSTTLSFLSILGFAGTLVGMLTMGPVVDTFGYHVGWLLASIFVLLSFLWALVAVAAKTKQH
ncbi:MAG: hypothetical protein DRO67_08970 [Candidatus Asgardarchaeum californiense]|nr:MAG: hypothetical protein DRO67_08970 [Candidatus Asgardarchaeum californiense]